jgi:hypothetical protein
MAQRFLSQKGCFRPRCSLEPRASGKRVSTKDVEAEMVRNFGSVSQKPVFSSPCLRPALRPAALPFALREWEQSAPGGGDGCSFSPKVAAHRDVSPPPRAQASGERWATRARALRSCSSRHSARLPSWYPYLILVVTGPSFHKARTLLVPCTIQLRSGGVLP